MKLNLTMLKSITSVLIILFSFTSVYSGEYTELFILKKIKAKGESLKGDPVESFNSAVEYATQLGEAQGKGYLMGESQSRDSVLDSIWIEKESNLQVVDLEVLDYKFNPVESDGNLITDISINLTLEYLNVPKFMDNYTKTLTGATFRSMAIPGWGQFYNRQYTTSLLYGTAFWFFYGMFVNAAKAATSQDQLNSAFTSFQIPAMVFWLFNVSESWTSRFLGKQGLINLRQAYHLDNFTPKYERKTERGMKIDFVLFEVPLYKLWK